MGFGSNFHWINICFTCFILQALYADDGSVQVGLSGNSVLETDQGNDLAGQNRVSIGAGG